MTDAPKPLAQSVRLRVVCPVCGQRHRMKIQRGPNTIVVSEITCARTQCGNTIRAYWNFVDRIGCLAVGDQFGEPGAGITHD